MAEDRRVQLIRDNIGVYPDFPKKGIIFNDVFGVMLNPEAFKAMMDILKEKAASLRGQVDCVVGLDARGFLFGPTMALELGVPFVPVRKSGKLPGDLVGISYDLEYGSASVQMQQIGFQASKRVLVVDDLFATGGTMAAAVELVRKVGSTVVECVVIMELSHLNGRAKLPPNTNLTALVTYWTSFLVEVQLFSCIFTTLKANDTKHSLFK